MYLLDFAGKYKTQLFDETNNDFMPASPGIGMHVEVTDPDKKILLSKYYASEGRFTFTSHTPGEHTICLHSNSTKWSLFAGGKLVSICSKYYLLFLSSCFSRKISLIAIGQR